MSPGEKSNVELNPHLTTGDTMISYDHWWITRTEIENDENVRFPELLGFKIGACMHYFPHTWIFI